MNMGGRVSGPPEKHTQSLWVRAPGHCPPGESAPPAGEAPVTVGTITLFGDAAEMGGL